MMTVEGAEKRALGGSRKFGGQGRLDVGGDLFGAERIVFKDGPRPVEPGGGAVPGQVIQAGVGGQPIRVSSRLAPGPGR